MSKRDEVVVSISCITYNHVSYIAQCLDGFLMQKTTFKFEVLIHDDASTDGTQDIIKEYQLKYPDIIKPIIQKENQYSQGYRGFNAKYNYSRAKGKYIALCEGDDYWIDPYKLQKQVDFLEQNPEYILSNSDADILYQESGYYIKDSNKIKGIKNFSGNVTLEQLLKGNYFIRTATVLILKEYVLGYYESRYYKEMSSFLLMGDTPLWAFLSLIGKFHYISSSTSVYRRRRDSACNQVDISKRTKFKLSSAIMRLGFIEYYPNSFSKRFKKKCYREYNKLYYEYALLTSKQILNTPFEVPRSVKKRLKRVNENDTFNALSVAFVRAKQNGFMFIQALYYKVNSILEKLNK